MSKPKAFNITAIYRFIILGVLTWAGATLESVRREVDVIKVQLTDYKSSVDDKFTVLKSDDTKRDVMISQIQLEISRLRRAAPPKQTP